jgi:hypothetical protein
MLYKSNASSSTKCTSRTPSPADERYKDKVLGINRFVKHFDGSEPEGPDVRRVGERQQADDYKDEIARPQKHKPGHIRGRCGGKPLNVVIVDCYYVCRVAPQSRFKRWAG